MYITYNWGTKDNRWKKIKIIEKDRQPRWENYTPRINGGSRWTRQDVAHHNNKGNDKMTGTLPKRSLANALSTKNGTKYFMSSSDVHKVFCKNKHKKLRGRQRNIIVYSVWNQWKDTKIHFFHCTNVDMGWCFFTRLCLVWVPVCLFT